MKALIPLKAAPLDPDELDAWFAGKLPRRLLAIPFGGPIPKKGAPLGSDLDGEFFDAETDIYGPYSVLRSERERLVDWHHRQDPTGKMGPTIIGKAILDEEPDEDGWWESVWLKAGEARLALIRRLQERGAALFGSSEAIFKKVDENGRITVWPYVRQTLSTSPQNTLSVLRPMKASLDALDSTNLGVSKALASFLNQVDNLGTDLSQTWTGAIPTSGDVTAKAGRVLSARNERALRDALALLSKHLDDMAGVQPEPPTEGDASTTS